MGGALHEEGAADDDQGLAAGDSGLRTPAQGGHFPQSLPVFIADGSGGGDLFIGDGPACPPLHRLAEQLQGLLVADLVQTVAGKQPIDKLHRRHRLFRLHPAQLSQVQIDTDDDIGAVGDGQGIDLAVIGPVHDLFKLGPDHRVEGVFQILVGLHQGLSHFGVDPHRQHAGGQYELVRNVAAQLPDHLSSIGAPPGGHGLPVVVDILQRGKGLASQCAFTDAHKTSLPFRMRQRSNSFLFLSA